MLQGVMKHLISWLTSPGAFGTAKIDAHCRSLPPNHHITTFVKGITILSRVTGLEHKQMCKILLGLITDLPLPSGGDTAQILRTARALLDFLYLAQLPSHTANTLLHLEESLARFHDNCHGRSVCAFIFEVVIIRDDKVARDRGIVHMICTRACITYCHMITSHVRT